MHDSEQLTPDSISDNLSPESIHSTQIQADDDDTSEDTTTTPIISKRSRVLGKLAMGVKKVFGAVHKGFSGAGSAHYDVSGALASTEVNTELIDVSLFEEDLDLFRQGLSPEQIQQIINGFETLGYVREPLFLSEQAKDTTRTTTFEYAKTTRALHTDTPRPEHIVEMTEYEGINEFIAFLTEVDPLALGRREKKIVKDMLENLTFIGEQEYQEAASGIAAYWKTRLEADSELQLCILTEISNSGFIKSDKYLLDTILSYFTDDELAKYEGRIILDESEISVVPEKLKIIMLDDWVISGSQMKAAYLEIKNGLGAEYLPCLEIQLVAATNERTEDGLKVGHELKESIPVKTYFLAHESKDATRQEARITGSHSAVDFDFEDDILRILHCLNSANGSLAEKLKMPPLTNIYRKYRKPGFVLLNIERFEKQQHRDEGI